jgi:hypothetical protein
MTVKHKPGSKAATAVLSQLVQSIESGVRYSAKVGSGRWRHTPHIVQFDPIADKVFVATADGKHTLLDCKLSKATIHVTGDIFRIETPKSLPISMFATDPAQASPPA